eukprot:TRINITY_DN5898_c0_g1_i1.p1 TRINITY_DN5898_c0_g1~~TRINITY_DN5898_c0_g1_i1.p1  ORF type:complete len:169 (-),score=26.34 TRINITY_DN5898_c0_g1_i1:88-561(-)
MARCITATIQGLRERPLTLDLSPLIDPTDDVSSAPAMVPSPTIGASPAPATAPTVTPTDERSPAPAMAPTQTQTPAASPDGPPAPERVPRARRSVVEERPMTRKPKTRRQRRNSELLRSVLGGPAAAEGAEGDGASDRTLLLRQAYDAFGLKLTSLE